MCLDQEVTKNLCRSRVNTAQDRAHLKPACPKTLSGPYHNFLFDHLDGMKDFNFSGSKIWVILPHFKRGLLPTLGSKAQSPLYIYSTYLCLFLCSVVPNHMNYKCTIGDDATSITREELDITSDATLKWFRPGPDGSLIISDAGNSYTDTIVP
mgnify:CR=1 FL=1